MKKKKKQTIRVHSFEHHIQHTTRYIYLVIEIDHHSTTNVFCMHLSSIKKKTQTNAKKNKQTHT